MKIQLIIFVILATIATASMLYFLTIKVPRVYSDHTKPNNPTELIHEKIPTGVEPATFAAGCFWCTEAAFQTTNGVTNAISGYSGGEEYNPTYEEVYKETTSHREP